jgi:hypothetical protein
MASNVLLCRGVDQHVIQDYPGALVCYSSPPAYSPDYHDASPDKTIVVEIGGDEHAGMLLAKGDGKKINLKRP